MLLHYSIIIVTALVSGVLTNIETNEIDECSLPDDLVKEIAAYGPLVHQIIETALNGSFRGTAYRELALFVDKFGSRISGSESLERSIDYMLAKATAGKLDNVHGEEVKVPHWVRGLESATLVEPRNKSLPILGLGNSIGTPPEGILAEALVVRSFDDLKAKADEAKGKIVVFNEEWIDYSHTVRYRGEGATAAAKAGGVAALIRSVTGFSLNNPHTGMQTYGEGVKIPVASLTVEDAHFLQRLQEEGETVKILLKMEAQNLPEVTSRNVVFDLEGSENPEKIVVVSGHIDSWDVGSGAMDDGGGMMISWAALALLEALGLRPRRTIRGVLWTAEEFGYVGAFAYQKAHANETDNFLFFMESDSGTFEPVGLQYAGGLQGKCILAEIMKLLESINATTLREASAVGSDIEIWTGHGVPGASLDTKNDRYFWFHHSPADSLDVEDPVALDLNTALWASVAYVIADLSIDFPRPETKQH